MTTHRVELSHSEAIGWSISYYRTDDFTETYFQICPVDTIIIEFQIKILNWCRDGVAPYGKEGVGLEIERA